MNDTATNSITVLGLTGLTEDDNTGWVDLTEPGGPKVSQNPFVGMYAYGKTPLGYDQHILKVNSGAPVMGYWFDRKGALHLLALIAGRWNLNDGEHLPEVPGGFAKIDPETGKKEFPAKGALRELAEETDLEPDVVVMVEGQPFIGDRALFWKAVDDGNRVGMFEITDELQVAINQSPALTLLPWEEFVEDTVDGITLGSIARVMAGLSRAGLITVGRA